MKIEIKKALLEGHTPEEITEGIIKDTFNKYKKPLVAGAMVGFMGATAPNIYHGTFSPNAKQHTINVENAIKQIPSLKEYSHLTSNQMSKALDEKYKNDKSGQMKLAGEIMGDPGVQNALQAKNKYTENINKKYLQHDLPIGLLGGSLAFGGVAAGLSGLRRKINK